MQWLGIVEMLDKIELIQLVQKKDKDSFVP